MCDVAACFVTLFSGDSTVSCWRSVSAKVYRGLFVVTLMCLVESELRSCWYW